MQIPIFDGHNDLLTRLWQRSSHIDLPRMRRGGFAGGLFAVFILPQDGDLNFSKMGDNGYAVPLPDPMSFEESFPIAVKQIAILMQLIEHSNGALRLCRTSAEIDQCAADDVISVVLHMEGAEAIDTELHALEVFYAAGLRSLGPVWSRNTAFAHGVPMQFPATPDIGGGLTDAGVRLIKACNAKRILIDLSHINEKGFWDVARISDAPLITTHSNAWEICNSTRNLTDKQLDAIRDSDGIVGVNFATCFIRPDGKMSSDTDLSQLLNHIDYLIERLGDTRVALGSDFDGAVMPKEIGDIGGLDALRSAFDRHGYDAALQKKLCNENWRNLLQNVWGA